MMSLSRGALGPYSMGVAPRLFVSHPVLDQCLDSGAISIDGDQLTLSSLSDLPWTLHPAVLVTELDGEEEATQEAKALVGQVRTSEELDALGAEHFGTAVVVGELAYTVRPGFVVFSPDLGAQGAPGIPDVLKVWSEVFDAAQSAAS